MALQADSDLTGYLFSVSLRMVDALEENVMKDILSMGLERKERTEMSGGTPSDGLGSGVVTFPKRWLSPSNRLLHHVTHDSIKQRYRTVANTSPAPPLTPLRSLQRRTPRF